MSHPFQFFPLSLVRPLLTEVLLCIDEAVVDDEVDVRVVRVEELNNVRQVRVVQEESEVLRRNTMITNKTINTSSSSSNALFYVSFVPILGDHNDAHYSEDGGRLAEDCKQFPSLLKCAASLHRCAVHSCVTVALHRAPHLQ